MTFDQLYSSSKHSGKILDYVKFGPNGDSLMAFVVPYTIHDGSDKIVKQLTDSMYVSGYVLSFSEDMKLTSKMQKLGVGLCLLQFEARYSRKTFNFSRYLYHISPSRYFQKIAQQGITPRLGSQFYKYPSRVYLFNQASISFAKDYGVVKCLQMLEKKQQKWVNDNTFVVFAIDSDKMTRHQLYKNGKMTFYIDPCYDGKIGGIQACEAIYTYSNIPLDLIEDQCFVYELCNDVGQTSAKLKDITQMHQNMYIFNRRS